MTTHFSLFRSGTKLHSRTVAPHSAKNYAAQAWALEKSKILRINPTWTCPRSAIAENCRQHCGDSILMRKSQHLAGILASALLSVGAVPLAQAQSNPHPNAPDPVVPDAGAPVVPPSPQCILRSTDERPSTRSDDKLLGAWVAPRRQTSVAVSASGYVDGPGLGSLQLRILLNGQVVGESEEEDGSGILSTKTSAKFTLAPGQYRISVRPDARNKRLRSFSMKVSVDNGCV